MGLLQSAAGALGRAYDYVTPGMGSSRLTDWGGWGDKTTASPKPVSTPTYNPSSTRVDTSALDKQIADSNKALEAMRAQLAAQPRLPVYNTANAWASAQSRAENIVNPVYLDKLNQYLEAARLKRTQTEEQSALNKKDINTSLTQSLEDSATARARSSEDAATNLTDINATSGEYQKDSGTQFDRARMALLDAGGEYGASGLVRQQETNAMADRRREESAQERQFEGQRKAVETLKTRTFEDLEKSDTRAKGGAEAKIQREDVNLRNFIDNAALEEKDYRTQNELERQSEIAKQTSNQYSVGVRDFINSLIGSGARSQDIALAQQVYGI